MTIIGLTGLKTSGKDCAAKALIEDGWKRVALADPVRAMLYVLNPIVSVGPPGTFTRWRDMMVAVGYDEAKKHPEVRRLMKVFATEVARDMISPTVWLDLAVSTITSEPETNWVVTDVRFDNEAIALRRLGAYIVRLDRAGLVNDDPHLSEAGVSEHLLDAAIQNDGTVQVLHDRIRKAASVLGGLRRTG